MAKFGGKPERPRVEAIKHPKGFLAAFLLLVAATCPPSLADMVVDGYEPALHDRFVNDPSFIGNPFDWSGVGRGNWWATMISDSYFVSATHAHPGLNTAVRFYASNDSADPFVERMVVQGTSINGSDLWLGKLDAPVGPEITSYGILTADDPVSFENLELYTFGLSDTSPPQTNVRLGRNHVDFIEHDLSDPALGASRGDVFLYDYDPAGGAGADESYLRGGDSGGPSFTIVNGVPVLLGVHWFIYDDELGGVGSGDTLVSSYIDALNSEMVGESVSVVQAVPEPSSLWMLVLLSAVTLICKCIPLSRCQ